MDEAPLSAAELQGCHLVGCVHARVLRRELDGRPVGTPVQARFQRSSDGSWRVLVLVQDDEGQWTDVLDRSPWRPTRLHASRWLDYRTRAT